MDGVVGFSLFAWKAFFYHCWAFLVGKRGLVGIGVGGIVVFKNKPKKGVAARLRVYSKEGCGYIYGESEMRVTPGCGRPMCPGKHASVRWRENGEEHRAESLWAYRYYL